MAKREQILLSALMLVLLAVVAAVAAQGRAWSAARSSAESSWSPRFLAFALVVLIGLAWLAIVVWFARLVHSSSFGRRLRHKRLVALVVLALVFALVAFLYARFAHNEPSPFGNHPDLSGPRGGAQGAGQLGPSKGHKLRVHHASAVPPVWVWLPGGLLLVLLGAAGVAVLVRRQTPAVLAEADEELAARAVSIWVAESLDDLRRDRDPRGAVIACYARMERILAWLNLPRYPSEAPLEFRERALARLHVGRDSIHRLTDLFEEAKFSDHVVGEQMRTEAIDTLSRLQRELQATGENTIRGHTAQTAPITR